MIDPRIMIQGVRPIYEEENRRKVYLQENPDSRISSFEAELICLWPSLLSLMRIVRDWRLISGFRYRFLPGG